jgi:hypothetical protein
MKLFLQDKIFADTAKDKLNTHKIDPTNIYEPLIKMRKDKEHE